MDAELKCNRLTCRKVLSDKAVVTTCSHIFCVECANELFTSARLCPACESSLTEPDDVVVCSLHPSNDYKTSVLSGLTPSIILEICSRAIAFWQYQIHQENSFQQAVVRNVTEKNAQLQKQLDNVVREANGEISLLTDKTKELERDLELERRKVRDLQEGAKERDKEYQKLKAQHDKMKRKALLGPPNPNAMSTEGMLNLTGTQNQRRDEPQQRLRPFQNALPGPAVDIQAVVGGMDANRIQRTPLVNRRVSSNTFAPQNANGWQNQQPQAHQITANQSRNRSMQRQSFPPPPERTLRSAPVTDRSDSASEVENLLVPVNVPRRSSIHTTGWTAPAQQMSMNRPFQRNNNHNKFRPAVPR